MHLAHLHPEMLLQDGEELNCQLEESRSKLAGVQEEYQSERRKSEGIMLAQLEEHKGRMEAALAAQSVEHECALKALSATRDMQEQTKLQVWIVSDSFIG